MGSQGTLALGSRGGRGAALTLYPEPVFSEAQRYGTNGWPQEMRRQYFESLGYTAAGRPKAPLRPPEGPAPLGPGQALETQLWALATATMRRSTPRSTAHIASRSGRKPARS